MKVLAKRLEVLERVHSSADLDALSDEQLEARIEGVLERFELFGLLPDGWRGSHAVAPLPFVTSVIEHVRELAQ